LRDPDRFEAWLHRLTVRTCIDVARGRRRRVIEVELTPDAGPVVADASRSVADRDQLDRALGRLDPEGRAVIVLRYYLDLSLQETADALGIPLGTAKSRIHRSLEQMRIHVVGDDLPAEVPLQRERLA
jgi:RNA polymerase sigma factor (sigma-70 family)